MYGNVGGDELAILRAGCMGEGEGWDTLNKDGRQAQKGKRNLVVQGCN